MDEQQRRSLLMLLLAVGVGVAYFGYTHFFPPEGPAAEVAEDGAGDEGAASEGDDEASGRSGAERDAASRLEARRTATITTEHFIATFDNLGGGLTSFRLTGDPRFTEEDGEPIEVITTDREEYQPLRVALDGVDVPDDAIWEIESHSERAVTLRWRGPRVEVVRHFSAGEGPYQLWSTLRVINHGDSSLDMRPVVSVFHYVAREDEKGGGLIAVPAPGVSHGACVYDDETVRKDREKLVETAHGYAGDIHFAAVENVYFVQAIASHGAHRGVRCGLFASDRGGTPSDPHGTLLESQLIYPAVAIAPGSEESWQMLAFVGPKDPEALRLAGHRLSEVVDLGFFALIAQQFARLLSFIHGFVGNWGLAIILLTLMIRLLLFPLTDRSFKSMARMRQLKPEIDRINELYADDREKKGAAVMELYRKHGVNPVSGCLPQLIQLPIWWALYTSLSTNIALYHMPFTLWWTDLSARDPYYTLPLALGVLMHLQQRLTPTTMDPMQAKMMMWIMPVMITVFMLFLPSGLCLYMLTNSALGIVQQKYNEHRIQKQTSAAEPPSDDDSDGDDGESEPTDSADNKRSRAPKRAKRPRRARRGRA